MIKKKIHMHLYSHELHTTNIQGFLFKTRILGKFLLCIWKQYHLLNEATQQDLKVC